MFMYTPEEISALRKRLGLTHTEFAARIGVCENTAIRWQMGDRHPSYKCLVKLNKLAEEDKAAAVAAS